MKTKTMTHTPGPWNKFDNSTLVFGCDKVVIADTAPLDNAFRPRPEAEANARLIAVAPELLEELHQIVLMICGEECVTIEDCDSAKALIAKATGKPWSV